MIHLLTELVDNALAYSPPTTTVSLGSTTTPEGVTVEVADDGLGIPSDTLAALNETLRSGGDVTADTARRMGLFVVSRLAQRYGITVSASAQPGQRHHGHGVPPELRAPRHAAGRRARLAAAGHAPTGERPSPATPEPAARGPDRGDDQRVPRTPPA